MSQSCIEITTLVISILLSILTGIPALVASGWIIFVIILINGGQSEYSHGYSGSDIVFSTIFTFVVTVPFVAFFIVFFIFSSILICGVGMKKPVLVMTYFIFGILAEVGALAGVACCYLLERNEPFFMTLSYALIGYSVINIPFLVLVWLTYKKLKCSTNYQPCNLHDESKWENKF